MNREPDLLDWQEPAREATADVIPFPAARRAGKIRRVAAVLLSKRSERAHNAYWRQATAPLALGMARAGVGEVEIERQLRAFSEAVSLEMARRQNRGAREA